MNPKVSIIIPVFNCENYITLCLESVLNQSYKNIEIVIVNDGSTDGSEKIVNKYKEKDNRIIYYYQDNTGPSEARNKAISNSTGEYLVFIDSDDTVDERYVELLLDEMINSGSELVCCGYRDISEYGVLNYTDFNFESGIPLHSFMELVCKGTGGVLWSKIYKKEIIDKNNLKMDKNVFMSEDLVFVLQYASHCRAFSAIKEYLYNYNRLNQMSISANISLNYIQNYITVCEYIERIFRSVKFDEQKTNQVITDRIQNIVMRLVELQSINVKDLGMKNAIYNIKRILSIQFIAKYKCLFSTNNWFYKPYIFLVKRNLLKVIIIYGLYLHTLRSIKRKFKKRKQVSL